MFRITPIHAGLLMSLASAPLQAADYSLIYSHSNDRSGNLPLSGANISGDLFARVTPQSDPAGKIEEVRFYLDGAASPFHDEGTAPYELQGGRAATKAWDSTDLADGAHQIRTEVELADGTVFAFDTPFNIANHAPPPPLGPVAPVLQTIGAQSLRVGDSRVIDIRASDANGDALAIGIAPLPSFASFVDHGDGTASLTLAPLEADLGSRDLSVTVSDGEFSTSQSLSIEVQANLGDSFQLIYSESDDRVGSLALGGAAIDGDLFARLFPEQGPNGEAVDEVRFYLDGAGSPFHDEGSAPYELAGGRAATRPWDSAKYDDGNHVIRTEVVLADGALISFDTAFSIANHAPPPPLGPVAPLLQSIGDQSLRVGDKRVINIRASDANGDALSISSTALPGFVSFVDNGNGTASLTLAPLEADLGSRAITVSVSDAEFTVSETFSITVQANLGNSFQLIYSAANDRVGSTPLSGASLQGDLFARLFPEEGPNGEGVEEVRFYLDGAGNPFHDEGSAPYELAGGRAATRPWDTAKQGDGNHLIRTEVELDDGSVISFDTAFVIANSAPPANRAPELAAIGAQLVQVGGSLSLDIRASDADGDALSLSANSASGLLPGFASLIDHGDDTASFNLTPQAGDIGSHDFTITVSDGALQDSRTFTLQVSTEAPPPPPPVDVQRELPTAAGNAELIRYPYAQQPAADELSILWGTASSGDAQLILRNPDGSQRQVVTAETDHLTSGHTGMAEDLYLHRARLQDLPADSRFVYELSHDGELLARGLPLKSLPADDDSTLDFIAFGDMGVDDDDARRVRDAIASRSADGSHVYPRDFIVGLGDLAYTAGTHAEFDNNFFDQMSGKGSQPDEHAPDNGILLDRPFMTVLGNHEYDNDPALRPDGVLDGFAAPVMAGIPADDRERYYSFDAGPVHFVVLDTAKFEKASSITRSDEMMAWVEADLAASDKPWKIAFFHHSPFSYGKHGTFADITENRRMREQMVPVLQRHDVRLAFFGHDHMYLRTQPLTVVDSGADIGQIQRLADDSIDHAGGIVFVGSGNGGKGMHNRTTNPTEAGSSAWKYQRSSWGIGYDFVASRNGEPVLFDDPDNGNDAPQFPQWRKGFTRVQVTASGVEVTAYNSDGDVLDQFELTP